MNQVSVKKGGRRLISEDQVIRDRYQGCLLSGVVGDALGTPVEFTRRVF